MIILDTSVWIEFLRKNTAFFSIISLFLEERKILAVECVFGELLQGVKNNEEQNIILQYWRHLPKMNFENYIIEAGIYSHKNKLLSKGVGLIDTIILMHGIKSHSKIWTLDNNLLNIMPEELKWRHIHGV